MECSVHINAAHRPDYLDRCLAAFYRQSVSNFEVVIADDGSDAETLAVVARHREAASFPIRHIWQRPEGHRRAAILNKGIAACRSDYILFTDCDSLVPGHFVETHLNRRRRRRLLIGGRHKLNEVQTEILSVETVQNGDFEEMITSRDLWELTWRHWKNVWEIWLRKRRRPHNLGLNMSVGRKELEAINGYDNAFKGWGNADGDVRDRLRMSGVRPLSVWREVFVFHQWHPQIPRGEGNSDYAKRKNRPMRADNGLIEAAAAWQSEDLPAYEAFLKANGYAGAPFASWPEDV